jgi:hypothetical protein
MTRIRENTSRQSESGFDGADFGTVIGKLMNAVQLPERKAQISGLGRVFGPTIGVANLRDFREMLNQGLVNTGIILAGHSSRLKGIQRLHLHHFADGTATVRVIASNLPEGTPLGVDVVAGGQICDFTVSDSIKSEFESPCVLAYLC